MASSFVPKDREELLLRTPLTFGFSAPTDMYQPRNSQRDVSTKIKPALLQPRFRPVTHCSIIVCVSLQAPFSSRDGFRGDASRERQRAKMKKMSRNNPHTGTQDTSNILCCSYSMHAERIFVRTTTLRTCVRTRCGVLYAVYNRQEFLCS